MSWTVYTRSDSGSTWVQRDLLLDHVTISDAVNERSVANVTLLSTNGSFACHRGMGVRIQRDNATVFEGYVVNATEGRLGIRGERQHALECVDQHYLADKRVAAKAYQNITAGDIVRDLIAAYLGSEDISEGLVQDGPTVRAITFNYVPVSEAIQELATRAGFWWRVSSDKELDFGMPIVVSGGGSVTFADDVVTFGDDPVTFGGGSGQHEVHLPDVALANSVTVTKRSPGYRNRQWVKGGRDKTVTQIETQFGDSEKRAFAVGFPIAEEPTVQVSRNNGAFVTETVGVAGIQEGRQWSWSYGSVTVTQDSGETVLAAADRVRVSYTGMFDVIAMVNDLPSQVSRQAVEGGTGIVEHVISDRSSSTREAAFQMASELLDYFTEDAEAVRFTTLEPGFEPGQELKLTLPEAGISDRPGLVTGVEHFSVDGHPHAVVTVVSGPQEGSWAQWFGALSRRIDKAEVPSGDEVEVITTLETLSKDWVEPEVPNIFTDTYAAASLTPGAGTYPMFEYSERVRFMSWHHAGVELGRKVFTFQAGASTDEILTTTVLTTNDAVGDVDELAWWGGYTASTEVGTGVEVDRQSFVTTKTDIEQIQVEKTDRKWS